MSTPLTSEAVTLTNLGLDATGAGGLRPSRSHLLAGRFDTMDAASFQPDASSQPYGGVRMSRFSGTSTSGNAQNHTSHLPLLGCYIPFTTLTVSITVSVTHMGGATTCWSHCITAGDALCNSGDGHISPPTLSTLSLSSCKRKYSYQIRITKDYREYRPYSPKILGDDIHG